MAGHGAPWVENSKTTNWPQKRSLKWLIGTTKNFRCFAPDVCLPPLSNSFRRHCSHCVYLQDGAWRRGITLSSVTSLHLMHYYYVYIWHNNLAQFGITAITSSVTCWNSTSHWSVKLCIYNEPFERRISWAATQWVRIFYSARCAEQETITKLS